MKIKKLYQYLSMILTIIVLITSVPFTVFADNFNGTGSGIHFGTSTYEHVGSLHAYHYNQGFRCYIVNANGTPVSNLVDFVRYRPWDTQTLLKAAKTGATSERIELMLTQYWDRVGIWHNPGDDVDLSSGEIPFKRIKYLGGAKTDIWSVNTGNLNEVIYMNGQVPDQGGVLGYRSMVDAHDNIDIAPAKMYTIGDLEENLIVTMLNAGYDMNTITSIINIPDENNNRDRSEKISYINPKTGEVEEHYKSIVTPIESIENGLYLTGDAMKNFMMRPMDIEKYKSGEDKTLVINLFADMKMQKTNGLGVQVGSYEKLFEFYDKTIDDYYIDAVNKYNSLPSEEQAVTTRPMMDTMVHFNLHMAFEPITWQVPAVVSATLPRFYDNPWGYMWTDNQIVYGTVTNIHDYILNIRLEKAYNDIIFTNVNLYQFIVWYTII